MLGQILLASALFFTPIAQQNANVYSEEEVVTTKTYTCVEGNYTLTINEEDKTFTLVGENEEYKGTYKVNALGEYELYINKDEFLYKIKVDDTTMTFEIFKEITEEEAKEEVIQVVKDFLGQYFNSDLVGQIINWAIDVGLLTTIAGIYFKYRKYKAKSSEEIAKEVEKQIKDTLGNEFNKLSNEQIQNILTKIDKFDESLNVFEQALILAQDKTSEGKKALIEIIAARSQNQDTLETGKKVEDKIINEQKQEEKVKEEVKKEYTPID